MAELSDKQKQRNADLVLADQTAKENLKSVKSYFFTLAALVVFLFLIVVLPFLSRFQLLGTVIAVVFMTYKVYKIMENTLNFQDSRRMTRVDEALLQVQESESSVADHTDLEAAAPDDLPIDSAGGH